MTISSIMWFVLSVTAWGLTEWFFFLLGIAPVLLSALVAAVVWISLAVWLETGGILSEAVVEVLIMAGTGCFCWTSDE